MSDPINVNGRCGPLCQHPGCWQSTQAPQGNSNSYYLKYVSRLASRKSRDRHSDENQRHCSSLTPDGLPTLKVLTLEHGHMIDRGRRRTQSCSLPSVKINEGRQGLSQDSLGLKSRNKSVNFVQMHLEEEPVACDEIADVVYSPILSWKPGKHPHTHHTPNTMMQVPLHTQQPSPQTPSHSANASRPVSRPNSCPSDPCKTARSQLNVKRTDLTYSSENVSCGQLKRKEEESQQRVTTSEAENFSYLGDVIPPQIVAEIIHQLRSESTSHIKKTAPATQCPTNDDRGNSTPPPTHIPSSLMYDLSTKKLSKTKKPPFPKTRTTSFSRELSKRPFEVLQRKPNRLQSMPEIDTVIDEKFKPPLIHLAMIQPPMHTVRSTTKSLDILLQRQSHHSEENTLITEHNHEEEQPEEEQQISPRRINLELSHEFIATNQDNRCISQKRSKPKMLTPSLNLPLPFSEEASKTTTPKPSASITEPRRVDSQPRLPSASPDFMLMGAHFTDNRLVLTDKKGKIVHQLTETEFDANMLMAPDIDGAEPDLLQVPQSGVRPPPSTAVDDIRTSTLESSEDIPSIIDTPLPTEMNSQPSASTSIEDLHLVKALPLNCYH